MVKKVVIEVSLVEESDGRNNKEIERDICRELSENIHLIPWAAKLDQMRISET